MNSLNSTDEQIHNAVLDERNRIKAIIRTAYRQIRDEPPAPDETEEERKRSIDTAFIFIQVFTDIESAIDQHNVSRITIGERQGVR